MLPQKKRSQIIALIAATSFLLLQSGCVYLRLLEVKNQLKDFDQNFKIESGKEFVVYALDPVITDDDLLYLTKVNPSQVHAAKSDTKWTYIFEKVNKDGKVAKDDKNIVFDMVFNEKSRISQFQFHEIFLQIVPSDFIEGSLRALGNAKIDKRNRKVDADSAVWKGKKLQAPLAEDIIEKLGKPLKEEKNEKGHFVYYKYRLRVPNSKKVKESNRIAEVTLEFDKETDQLERLHTKFAGMKLSVNYQKIIEKSKRPIPAS